MSKTKSCAFCVNAQLPVWRVVPGESVVAPSRELHVLRVFPIQQAPRVYKTLNGGFYATRATCTRRNAGLGASLLHDMVVARFTKTRNSAQGSQG